MKTKLMKFGLILTTMAFFFGSASAQSFTDNGDGTVLDKNTRLTWQKCSAGLSGTDCATGTAITYTWANALTYCENLELPAGTTDWRLPNIKELRSIVDNTTSSPAIDVTTFPATVSSSSYWSSTSYASYTSYAWAVYFSYGSVYGDDKTSSWYVRCVR